MLKQVILSFVALFFLSTQSCAQDPLLPKRECRGVWVATVKNIDYPKRPTKWDVALKEEWKILLKKYKELGINTVIVQVRPAGDAIYPSELVPWSAFLTGEQGLPPDDNFDPLAFMIEEAHKNSMEFHAWLNPYRATVDLDTMLLAPNHIFHQKREWMVKYGKRFYLNPALIEVQEHLTEVVEEIVNKYDIDAIHFDDYFYPYGVKGETFPDSLDFANFGLGYSNIADWRRQNVDNLIQKVGQSIKQNKSYVKFGISPFGVWRNYEDDKMGSKTKAGITCYDDLYADVLKWLRRDWIDYVVPQLYWNIGFEPADHAVLLDWWSANTYNKQLYTGHAAYKVGQNNEPAWEDPNEIPEQIRRQRMNFNSSGSIFFSSRSLLENRKGVRDSLQYAYRYPAILPETELEDGSLALPSPPELKKVKSSKGAVKLRWKPNEADKNNLPAYYILYRFLGSGLGNFEDPANIIHITPFHSNQKDYCFLDGQPKEGRRYTYVVKAVNRLHQESKASRLRKIQKKKRGVKNLK